MLLFQGATAAEEADLLQKLSLLMPGEGPRPLALQAAAAAAQDQAELLEKLFCGA